MSQAPGDLSDPLAPYDAVVLLSFGGPEAPDQVMPFLKRVTAGRAVPPERLEEVAQHYLVRGGVSPINKQNRALVEALRNSLVTVGSSVGVVLGNRNSEPFLGTVLANLAGTGARRIVVVTTSGYSSYASCRQYRENLADAMTESGLGHLMVDKVEPWFGLGGFVDTVAESTLTTVLGLGQDPTIKPAIAYVTHSIPQVMNDTSGPGDEAEGAYVRQHLAVARRITEHVAAATGRTYPEDLVFCSRSGPPAQRWLEPDVRDHLRALADRDITDVVVVPIGFVSDHMEVVEDLDHQAVAVGRALGLRVHRVPTVGTHPRFVSALTDLLQARAAQARGDHGVGAAADFVVDIPRPDPVCPAGCCPNLRDSRPAASGVDP